MSVKGIATVIDLEKKLLDPIARKDLALLNELIDESFIEFGTSGRIYSKNDILENLAQENLVAIDATDFLAVLLAPDVIQVRFKTRIELGDHSVVTSLRSSIWKKNGQKWQMIFHQGTRTST